MEPDASGECCTVPVAIRMAKGHRRSRVGKMYEIRPVSAPPIGNTAYSGGSIEKNIERDFPKSLGFRRWGIWRRKF